MIDKSGAGLFRDIFGRVSPNDNYHLRTSSDSIYNPGKFCSYKVISIHESMDAMSNIAHKSNFIRLEKDDPAIVSSKVFTAANAMYMKRYLGLINSINHNYGANSLTNVIESELHFDNILRSSEFYEANCYPVHNFDLLEDTSDPTNDRIFYDKLINVSNHSSFPYTYMGPTYMTSPGHIPVLTLQQKNNAEHLQIKNLTITYDNNKYGGLFKTLKVSTSKGKYHKVNIITAMFMIDSHMRTIRMVDKYADSNATKMIDVYIPKTIVTIKYCIDSEKICKFNQYILSTNATSIDEILIDKRLVNIITTTVELQTSCVDILTYYDRDLLCFLAQSIINNHSMYTIRWGGIKDLIKVLKDAYTNGVSVDKDGNTLHNTDALVYMINNGVLQPWKFGNVFQNKYDHIPCMKFSGLSTMPFNAFQLIKNHGVINLTDAFYGFYIDFFETKFNTDMHTFPWIDKKEFEEYLVWRKKKIHNLDSYIRKKIAPIFRKSTKLNNT